MTQQPPTPLPMYQGQDWAQQLSYFQDEAQTTPLVFANPVMDVRDPDDGSLLARFDESGGTTAPAGGLITQVAPGQLVLTMPAAATAQLTDGSYQLDVFADVADEPGQQKGRQPITRRGLIVLQVIARLTEDPA